MGTRAGFVGDDEDVYVVLESGIRDIYGEVRNSLDFHRSQEGGGEVSTLSSAARPRGFLGSLTPCRPRSASRSSRATSS